MNELGRFFQNGRGGPPDFALARDWFERAAARGHADAMTQLGRLHHIGSGMPIDFAKAREWYQKAEIAGDKRSAPYYLGLMFENGEGVTKDTQVAFGFFKTAADAGNDDAKLALERVE